MVSGDAVGVSGGPGITDSGRVQAWRCSQGSLRKQSSIEETGEPTGNGWRLSPAPPLSSRYEHGEKLSLFIAIKPFSNNRCVLAELHKFGCRRKPRIGPSSYYSNVQNFRLRIGYELLIFG